VILFATLAKWERAFRWWMITDWEGNVPEHRITGNMSKYKWQWPVLAFGWLAIVVFTYVMLAIGGHVPWIPFS
jgi:hypothetical protein